MLHLLQRHTDLRQGDALHVWAEVARPNEGYRGVLHGEIVAHRAFGDQCDPCRLLRRDEVAHHRRRAGEISFGDDIRWAFWVGQHDQTWVFQAKLADFGGREALMHHAMAGPGDDLDTGLL